MLPIFVKGKSPEAYGIRAVPAIIVRTPIIGWPNTKTVNNKPLNRASEKSPPTLRLNTPVVNPNNREPEYKHMRLDVSMSSTLYNLQGTDS